MVNNKQIKDNPQTITKKGNKPFIIGLCGGIGSGKSTAAQILKGKGAYIIDTDKISKEVAKSGSECEAQIKAAFPRCVVDGVLQKNLLKSLVFSDEGARILLNSITHPHILAEVVREIEAVSQDGLAKGIDAVSQSEVVREIETTSQNGWVQDIDYVSQNEVEQQIEPASQDDTKNNAAFANQADTATVRQTEDKKLVVVQVPLLFESGFDRLCDLTACVVGDEETRLRRVTERDGITRELALSIMASQLSDKELKRRCDFVIDNGGDIKRLEGEVEKFFHKVQKIMGLSQ